jgi:hypothetical protein
MKIPCVLVLGGVIAWPAVALAEIPFDPGRLGQMKGVLEVCSRVAPRAASEYLLQMKAVIGSATKAMVDEAARTEEYQQAYQSVRSEFSSLSQDGIVASCTSYLAATN